MPSTERALRYFDHAAAMPCFPEALEAYAKAASSTWANPSSLHSAAQRAEALLEESRETLARGLGCRPSEVVLTASGTESDNLALRGSLRCLRNSTQKKHVLTTTVEHPAVANTLAALAVQDGYEVECLQVSREGGVTPEALAAQLRSDTALVSIIWGSNEVGTLNPVRALATLCRERGVLFHTDAVQAAAWLPFSFSELGADLVSIGGRKLGAPAGGALLVRKGVPLEPLFTGGPQEASRRAGTPDVPQAAAMAAALLCSRALQSGSTAKIIALRNKLIQDIPARISDCLVTGATGAERLPNHASFIVEGVEGNALCRQLDLAGFACSPGAACKTGRPGPSALLQALGFSEAQARCGLRVSLGWETTEEDVEALVKALVGLVARLRTAR